MFLVGRIRTLAPSLPLLSKSQAKADNVAFKAEIYIASRIWVKKKVFYFKTNEFSEKSMINKS